MLVVPSFVTAFLMLAAPSRPAAALCFPAEAKVGAFKMEWFCRQLAAADEAQLVADPAYRFTYIPSFHSTRVAVAFVTKGKPVVVGKVLSGRGGYDAGRLVRTTRQTLTPDQWRLLEQRLELAGLWESPDRDDRSGTDGARWVVEGRKGGRYAIHDVWSPNASALPEYRKACEYLLELAGIKPEAESLY